MMTGRWGAAGMDPSLITLRRAQGLRLTPKTQAPEGQGQEGQCTIHWKPDSRGQGLPSAGKGGAEPNREDEEGQQGEDSSI